MCLNVLRRLDDSTGIALATDLLITLENSLALAQSDLADLLTRRRLRQAE